MSKGAPKEHQDFHAHLDACKQCREHPFDLCAVGAEALRKTVNDIVTPRPRSFF